MFQLLHHSSKLCLLKRTFCQRIPSLAKPVRYRQSQQSSAQIFSLCSQVECDPLCDLLWTREDVPIETDDEMFEIIEEVLPEDPDNNVFTSVRSTLRKRANITFDHEETNLTISCQVSDHQVGDSISSSMSVLVECKCLLYLKDRG